MFLSKSPPLLELSRLRKELGHGVERSPGKFLLRVTRTTPLSPLLLASHLHCVDSACPAWLRGAWRSRATEPAACREGPCPCPFPCPRPHSCSLGPAGTCRDGPTPSMANRVRELVRDHARHSTGRAARQAGNRVKHREMRVCVLQDGEHGLRALSGKSGLLFSPPQDDCWGSTPRWASLPYETAARFAWVGGGRRGGP